MQRIIAIEKTKQGTVVTTTDIHLARGIGEALHHAYQGELEFHFNPDQNLLARQLEPLMPGVSPCPGPLIVAGTR